MFHNNLEGDETAASRFNNAGFDKWRVLWFISFYDCYMLMSRLRYYLLILSFEEKILKKYSIQNKSYRQIILIIVILFLIFKNNQMPRVIGRQAKNFENI